MFLHSHGTVRQQPAIDAPTNCFNHNSLLTKTNFVGL